MEHERRADDLEREAEVMEQHSERIGDHIEEARRGWEAKTQDPAVPGAQPSAADDPAREGETDDESEAGPTAGDGDGESDDHEPIAGVEADEELLREEGGA